MEKRKEGREMEGEERTKIKGEDENEEVKEPQKKKRRKKRLGEDD